jgi:hypothetical protein
MTNGQRDIPRRRRRNFGRRSVGRSPGEVPVTELPLVPLSGLPTVAGAMFEHRRPGVWGLNAHG